MNKKRKVTGKSVYLTEKELDLATECIFELRDSGHPFTENEQEYLAKLLNKLNKATQSIKEQQSDNWN